MQRRTLRTFAQATTCLAVGVAFTAGCLYAVQPDDLTGPSIVPSSGHSTAAPTPAGRLLTSEEIDVLTESESPNHPWEQCRIDGELITCPDGYTVTWQTVPEDGAEYRQGVYAMLPVIKVCPDTDEPAVLPCRVPMDPTYVVGGDGKVHEPCVIVLTTAEDSEMICRDDTVWAS